jgi:putative ABC transport system permease protein
MTWSTPLDELEQDARFAWRSLRRNPAMTALIVVMLTLGIGVNAATFSILDRIYLRPPAGVVEPGSVHRLWIRLSQMEGGPQYTPAMTYPMYRVIRNLWSDSNEVALVDRVGDLRIGGTRRGARIDVLFATANYWPMLGVKPQLGRFYSADDDNVRQPTRVVVLSHHLWRTQFGADPAIVGKSVKLDEDRYTIIGVAPRGFTGIDLESVDAWLPLGAYPQPPWMKEPIWDSHAMYVFQAIARSRPHDQLDLFASRATQTLRSFMRTVADKGGDTLVTVATGSIIYARGPGEPRQEHVISTRLGAVALIVLLIAAANVINLLLARATRRRREIAVRLALGAGRWRVVRMLTAETLLLAAIAATASVLAAWWGGAMLRALLLSDVRFVDAPIDTRIIVFTFALAIVAGLIAGIVPALQASNPVLTRALKEGSRDGTTHRSRLRSALVITQAALSILLLTGAALFVESLRNVQAVDIGYDPSRTVLAWVDFDPGQSPPDGVQAARIAAVAERLRSAPGVQAVARSNVPPMRGFSVSRIWIGGDSAFPRKKSYPVLNSVSGDYFGATGLKMLRGHAFADVPGAPTQVVINQAMAEQQWPNEDPMGQCIRFAGPTSACYAVVGIVQTARRDAVIEDPVPQYYLSAANLPPTLREQFGNVTALEVRAAAGSDARVAAEVTSALRAAFPPGYPEVELLRTTIDWQYRPWRVGAALFTGMGGLALIVAVLGIYSTMSYNVTQRTHEFGVRVAVGAELADILRLVLGEGLRVVVAGVVVGAALAVAAGRLIAALLYGIAPSNPLVLASVSALVIAAAVVATLIPASRAAGVDPIAALRAD